LTDNQSGELIKILIGDKVYSMDESLSSGNFSGEIRLSEQEFLEVVTYKDEAQYIKYKVLLPVDDVRVIEDSVQVISNDGTIVICDVDDTIKISEVYISESRLLENIFFNSQIGIENMKTLLTTIEDENSEVEFYYVSGSPKQLYQNINNFIEKENYPQGFIYLRDFQLSPFTSSFYNFLDSDSTYKHKVDIISELLEKFPRREFIFIGDSGEKNPEVYGSLMKKHSTQIKEIYIRNVTSETIDNQRINKAFELGKEKLTLVE